MIDMTKEQQNDAKLTLKLSNLTVKIDREP
jgi:hypothetical protein